MKTIKDKVIRDIRNSFEQTEQYYYKPEKVSEYQNDPYIEHESNGTTN